MNLRSQIESVVASMSSGILIPVPDTDPVEYIEQPYTFRYARKQDENIFGDNESYPAIILLEPDQFGFSLNAQSGQIRDRTTTFVQFVDKRPEIAEKAEDRETTVEAMKTIAAKFILKLNQSNLFQSLPDNYSGVLIAEVYDSNVCGIEIQIPNLTDMLPRSLC